MFTVIANQIIISKDRETRRVEEEFKRLKSAEEAQTEENEEILHLPEESAVELQTIRRVVN